MLRARFLAAYSSLCSPLLSRVQPVVFSDSIYAYASFSTPMAPLRQLAEYDIYCWPFFDKTQMVLES